MKTELVPGKGRVPYPAYRGDKPYAFVSYAHADADLVFEEIRKFNESGFNVWYDEGIAPGNEWTDEIADALSGCTVFVVMITPRSANRINVTNEINYALSEGKQFLAIHLENTELQRGVKLRIGTKQAIKKYLMSEEEYVYKYTEAFTQMGLSPEKDSEAQETLAAPEPNTEPKPEARRKPGKKLWLIAVLAVLLLTILGVLLRPAKEKGADLYIDLNGIPQAVYLGEDGTTERLVITWPINDGIQVCADYRFSWEYGRISAIECLDAKGNTMARHDFSYENTFMAADTITTAGSVTCSDTNWVTGEPAPDPEIAANSQGKIVIPWPEVGIQRYADVTSAGDYRWRDEIMMAAADSEGYIPAEYCFIFFVTDDTLQLMAILFNERGQLLEEPFLVGIPGSEFVLYDKHWSA